ncbi:hypothetical protein [Cohnella cholangitidis]|uniref:Uncharacterized protein n=1 Tax=Cohnella cholangitidis TaxID=2598458 RepID=A0A7G5BU70_9BACL|nr:hypothetical protein [Cohnella cholangitidis]QMV40504.1 hypothetical protein FPL14_04250 [Cohnella cholangitidis]
MNEWSTTIWASISAMTAALVLTLIITLGSLARESANIQQESDAAVENIKEYRKYNQFDGTINLFPTDVITAITESDGMPKVTVYGRGPVSPREWSKATPASQFRTSELVKDNVAGGLFDPTDRYTSELVPDANGAIVQIIFRRQ